MLTIALTGRMPHAALETETTGHLDVLRDADVDARVIQDEIRCAIRISEHDITTAASSCR